MSCPASHVPPAFHGFQHGDLVGVFDIAADRRAHAGLCDSSPSLLSCCPIAREPRSGRWDRENFVSNRPSRSIRLSGLRSIRCGSTSMVRAEALRTPKCRAICCSLAVVCPTATRNSLPSLCGCSRGCAFSSLLFLVAGFLLGSGGGRVLWRKVLGVADHKAEMI